MYYCKRMDLDPRTNMHRLNWRSYKKIRVRYNWSLECWVIVS